jgi:four helix bundle protein
MESNYKKLEVWKKSILLCKKLYIVLQDFPKIEIYGLTDQMRRASVSIASNIAEWSGRGSDADFARFLYIAKWSTTELETQIYIAHELGYISEITKNELETEIVEVLKMLAWLIRSKSK